MEPRFFQPRRVGREIDLRQADGFFSDFARRVFPFAIFLDFFGVRIISDDVQMLCKCHGNRHPDIAETDKRQFRFFSQQRFQELHRFHFFLLLIHQVIQRENRAIHALR